MSHTHLDPQRIRAMFGRIAGRYDLANTALSFGIHHRWRKKLVGHAGVQSGQRVLDLATGTGDLAITFKQAVGPTGEVIGTDFCQEMVEQARQKVKKMNLDVRFEEADAMNLPHPDASFDITSIAFGIRNIADPVKTMFEMARVTKPGGVVAILEFGQPLLPVWKQLYALYAHHIIPRLGGLITGAPWAYRYLEQSSANFPCRDEFLELMRKTGRLEHPDYWALTGGVAYIYTARSVLPHST
ncbi:MAG: bifunctional demethylmenaquinone methyltransferase/2-methoxy-6-polyprenyl-1,4-benzoquinol methylase UbiE [Deltaproteobacteria bacterium]|nr:bifunctional demethylmenaquinone methyltransferase/2-methoxy-6-polyprenyl-1,4-benzoquinol methylase UbiE [Deltaproteobacteria bacterium]